MRSALLPCTAALLLAAGPAPAADCAKPAEKLANDLAERARLLVESRLPDAAMTRWLQSVQTKAEALADLLRSGLPPAECPAIAKELADGKASFEPVFAHFAAELKKREQVK